MLNPQGQKYGTLTYKS